MSAIADRRIAGQAMVEFALVLPLLIVFMFGILDLGRAIYTFNGVSQAAREIARVASVHPGAPLGTSPQATAMVGTQRTLVPGITDLEFHCVDIAGATIPGDGIGGCAPGDVVKVEVHSLYEPLTPLLGLIGPFDIQSFSSNQVQ